MIKITIKGKEYQFDETKEEPLMQQLVAQGVDIMAACGGAGLCTTCAIQVNHGNFTPRTQAEDDMFLPDDQRLSCQCRPTEEGDVELIYS